MREEKEGGGEERKNLREDSVSRESPTRRETTSREGRELDEKRDNARERRERVAVRRERPEKERVSERVRVRLLIKRVQVY